VREPIEPEKHTLHGRFRQVFQAARPVHRIQGGGKPWNAQLADGPGGLREGPSQLLRVEFLFLSKAEQQHSPRRQSAPRVDHGHLGKLSGEVPAFDHLAQKPARAAFQLKRRPFELPGIFEMTDHDRLTAKRSRTALFDVNLHHASIEKLIS
jgi:hypothetical protein